MTLFYSLLSSFSTEHNQLPCNSVCFLFYENKEIREPPERNAEMKFSGFHLKNIKIQHFIPTKNLLHATIT